MSVVVSKGLVLSETVDVNKDNPVIGWENLVTTGSISSNTANTTHTVTNLANPSTFLKWRGTSNTANEYLTVTISETDPIDYVAIARHNFGSSQATLSIEATANAANEASYSAVVSETLLADDAPALFRFTANSVAAVRLKIQPGDEVPELAVMYTGKLLVLPRRLYVGHTPIPYGRQSKIASGRSESGNFLGRIVLNEFLESSVSMDNVPPDYFRNKIHPFFVEAVETPFFFAWRPQQYNSEVGFCWLNNDSTMENQLPNGFVSIGFSFQGVVT